MTPPPSSPTGRRAFLVGGTALVGALVVGCGGDGGDGGRGDDAAGDENGDTGAGSGGDAGGGTTTSAAGGAKATTLTAADFDALGTCLLTPEQMEGPFYLPGDMVRRDITDGRTGHPLRLGIRVVDAECEPVAGALVDVWHCDVDGDYSGYADGSGSADDAAAGTSFLRGSQVANDEGIVEFATIYPGWYTGRAVHVHVKAHLDGAAVLTSQLYFPEDVTDAVHAAAPYEAHGTRDTRNEDDAIAGDPVAAGNLLATSEAGGATQGLVVLGIDPDT